jgi:hypothetical protein
MKKTIQRINLNFRTSRFLAQIANLLILKRPSRIFWTWELYGLGYSLKHVQGISQRRRISTSSDHGISFYIDPFSEESAIPANTHVTWSKWRTSLQFPDGRKVIRVRHPWIEYRKMHGFSLSRKASGTLVFVPHSFPGLSSEFQILNYLKLVSSLPKDFHPLVFCLQMHDVKKDLVHAIHNKGYSVVTVGNSLHPRYVHRFYGLLKNFEFATSPTVGSQLFYAHEFGVKYFLFDPENEFQRRLNFESPRQIHNDVIKRIENAFQLQNLFDQPAEKNYLVSEALGLDCEGLNLSDLFDE